MTLCGHVASFAEKDAAERCVQRVRGVKGIAEELAVRYAYDEQTSDNQIVQRVLPTISWDTRIPKDAISVKVEHGVVTLTGTVDWHFQKEAADNLVRKLSCAAAELLLGRSENAWHLNRAAKSLLGERIMTDRLVDKTPISH